MIFFIKVALNVTNLNNKNKTMEKNVFNNFLFAFFYFLFGDYHYDENIVTNWTNSRCQLKKIVSYCE